MLYIILPLTALSLILFYCFDFKSFKLTSAVDIFAIIQFAIIIFTFISFIVFFIYLPHPPSYYQEKIEAIAAQQYSIIEKDKHTMEDFTKVIELQEELTNLKQHKKDREDFTSFFFFKEF